MGDVGTIHVSVARLAVTVRTPEGHARWLLQTCFHEKVLSRPTRWRTNMHDPVSNPTAERELLAFERISRRPTHDVVDT